MARTQNPLEIYNTRIHTHNIYTHKTWFLLCPACIVCVKYEPICCQMNQHLQPKIESIAIGPIANCADCDLRQQTTMVLAYCANAYHCVWIPMQPIIINTKRV